MGSRLASVEKNCSVWDETLGSFYWGTVQLVFGDPPLQCSNRLARPFYPDTPGGQRFGRPLCVTSSVFKGRAESHLLDVGINT